MCHILRLKQLILIIKNIRFMTKKYSVNMSKTAINLYNSLCLHLKTQKAANRDKKQRNSELVKNNKMSNNAEPCYFCCARCLQPIHLDDSFSNINELQTATLNLPVRQNDVSEIELSASSLDHFVPPFSLKHDSEKNGFMVIENDKEVEIESLSQNLRLKAELFDNLSSISEINHPVCTDCSDFLLEMMDQQLKIAESEWNDYNNYLKKLELNEEIPDVEGLEKELDNLLLEETRLLNDLESLKKEEDNIKETIRIQEEEKKRLKLEDEKYWREYTKHRRELIAAEDEYRSLECQLNYSKSQLEKLKATNIFNVTFHIWHSGHFGTINNFRLGRLPSSPVDWSEINAAWGQTCLLLSALARKINLTFKRYNLVPYGNHSYIEVLGENKKELPLYGSGGFRFFWDTKFDAGMVAFVDCLQQFKEEVEKGDSGFCLPYKMDKGKIEDPATGNSYSVKIQFNSEEQWTKALKFLLTNLKWGLAYISCESDK